MVRASTSQSVDLGFISLVESYQKTLQHGIYSFSAGRSAFREAVENKTASSLVVSIGKPNLPIGAATFLFVFVVLSS